MEAAAISDGEMINYANIASDCGVAAKTVKTYYQILKDKVDSGGQRWTHLLTRFSTLCDVFA